MQDVVAQHFDTFQGHLVESAAFPGDGVKKVKDPICFKKSAADDLMMT